MKKITFYTLLIFLITSCVLNPTEEELEKNKQITNQLETFIEKHSKSDTVDLEIPMLSFKTLYTKDDVVDDYDVTVFVINGKMFFTLDYNGDITTPIEIEDFINTNLNVQIDSTQNKSE